MKKLSKSLIRKAKQGDPVARERVVADLTDYVGALAWRASQSPFFQHSYVDLDDLKSEGMAAVYEAIDQYDIEGPATFETFAWYLITHVMGAAIKNATSGMRVPIGTLILRAKLIEALENDPTLTDEELVEMFKDFHNDGVSIRRIRRALAVEPPAHLDFAITTGEDHSGEGDVLRLHDVIADGHSSDPNFDQVAHGELAVALEEAISKLDDEDQMIVRAYFGIGAERRKLREIGEDLGISGQAVGARLEKVYRHLALVPDLRPFGNLDTTDEALFEEALAKRARTKRKPARTLTPEEVAQLREDYANGEGTMQELATKYDVSRSAAQRMLTDDEYGGPVARRDSKFCGSCSKTKPVTAFHRRTINGKPSYQPRCKQCASEKASERFAERPPCSVEGCEHKSKSAHGLCKRHRALQLQGEL